MASYVSLTSADNPAVKQAARVRDSAAARRRLGLFFAEGARLCADAARSGVPIHTCFFTPGAREKYKRETSLLSEQAARCFEISEKVCRKLSDTSAPQGVFCLCAQRAEPDGAFDAQGRYLALENVSDPSNLGACARTAEALGIAGLILSPGCCDPYNAKALRASMGAFFRLPLLLPEDFPALLQKKQAEGFRIYGSVPDRAAINIAEVPKPGCICLVGNEGNGLTEEAKALCDRLVTIPMPGRAESLNAAAAAAILMWELMKP